MVLKGQQWGAAWISVGDDAVEHEADGEQHGAPGSSTKQHGALACDRGTLFCCCGCVCICVAVCEFELEILKVASLAF